MYDLNLRGVRIVGGLMFWYGYNGSLFFDTRQIPPTGPSGSGGWAYKDAQVFVENGAGDGWQEALNTYLSGGGCTPGWEICVDGVLKCDRSGNLV